MRCTSSIYSRPPVITPHTPLFMSSIRSGHYHIYLHHPLIIEFFIELFKLLFALIMNDELNIYLKKNLKRARTCLFKYSHFYCSDYESQTSFFCNYFDCFCKARVATINFNVGHKIALQFHYNLHLQKMLLPRL